MGGQAEAWADWCRNNSRVGPGFTKEELYTKPAAKPPAPPKPPPPPKKPAEPQKPPFCDLAELLADANRDLEYITRLPPLTEKPLAVLSAMIEEDRPAFLEFLKESGVESLAHRQALTNALSKGVREGRITRGWAKPEVPKWETQCGHCGKQAAPTTKLSICARCKSVKYCGAACQKAAWPRHKGVCQVSPAHHYVATFVPSAGRRASRPAS